MKTEKNCEDIIPGRLGLLFLNEGRIKLRDNDFHGIMGV